MRVQVLPYEGKSCCGQTCASLSSNAMVRKLSIRYPPGMESCLKKLVWDAEATDFQDPEKGGWEPVGPAGRKTLPGSLDWRQTGMYSQLPGGQKTNSG